MDTYKINIVFYADDAVLIAKNENDEQQQFQTFNSSGDNYKMQISAAKNKCNVISKEPRRCKLDIKRNII